MKYKIYYHNYLCDLKTEDIKSNTIETINRIEFNIYKGSSKALRQVILEELTKVGWSTNVELVNDLRINITSMNKGIGLCLQTGNMSRFYADLVKLEYLYKCGKIREALYILPLKSSALILGSNIANYNRFTSEINLFKDVITIPMLVIGIK